MAYRGVTARLPVGAQGFTGTRNQSQAGPGHLIFTDGAELDGGIIRKDGGAKLLVELGSYTSIRSLMHFDNAAEGSSVMTDDGFLGSVWSVVGGAKTTLTDFKFGPSALTLNGTTDWITSPTTGLTLGSIEWTFHTWFKCTAAGGTRRNLFGQVDAAGNNISTSILGYRNVSNLISVSVGQDTSLLTISSTAQYTSAVNIGWHHLAVVRDNSNPVSNKLRLFIDGVQQAEAVITGGINSSSATRAIGQCGAFTNNSWQGLVDETVIVAGKCMWTANFTPPSAPTLKYGSGANPPFDTPIPLIAGTSWSPSVGLDEDVVFLENGAVLSDPARTGTFNIINKEGLAATRDPPPYFCMGGGEDVGQPRKLFLFSKTNQVQIRKGGTSTFADISTPPADWSGGGNFPTFGCVHVLRMFAGGNASDPHRLYYSSVTNHEVYTGSGAGAAGTIPIYPGQGEKLVAAYSIRGALILWKYPVGVYVLQTQDPDPTTWNVEVLSRAVGAVNAHCVVPIENDLLYLDHSGSVHLLTATTDFGDFNTSNLSEIADMRPFIEKEINRAKLQRSQGIYYTTRRQAWFFMPRLNSDIPDLRLQIGFDRQLQGGQQQTPPRFFMSRRDTASALWLRPNALEGILKPTIGSEDGNVYLLDDEDRNKNGQGYQIQFSTPNSDLAFLDPSLATKHKTAQFLEISFDPEGAWDLLVDVYWDDVYTATVPFNMGGGGGVLGYMVLGSDTFGASGVKAARRRVPGSGRYFRMTCTNDGLNQNVSISGFHLSFVPGDERTAEQ